jgi:hypothetical protein
MNLFTEMQTLLQMLIDTAVIGGALAVGVLAGYAIFKLLTLASLLWFAKFVCQKIYELIKLKIDNEKDKPNYYTVEVRGKVLTTTDTEEAAKVISDALATVASKHTYDYMLVSEARRLAEHILKYNP